MEKREKEHKPVIPQKKASYRVGGVKYSSSLSRHQKTNNEKTSGNLPVNAESTPSINTSIHIDEDTKLMLLASRDDVQAFEKLYITYLPIVINYLASLNRNHIPLEDIVQEVFRRLWQNRDRYRPKSTFKTYVLGIARNILREKKRSEYKKYSVCTYRLHKQGLESSLASSDPKSEVIRKELKGQVNQAIEQLTEVQKQAVKLIHIQGMSIQEAAENAGCSVEALKSRLRRGCKRLYQLLWSL